MSVNKINAIVINGEIINPNQFRIEISNKKEFQRFLKTFEKFFKNIGLVVAKTGNNLGVVIDPSQRIYKGLEYIRPCNINAGDNGFRVTGNEQSTIDVYFVEELNKVYIDVYIEEKDPYMEELSLHPGAAVGACLMNGLKIRPFYLNPIFELRRENSFPAAMAAGWIFNEDGTPSSNFVYIPYNVDEIVYE